MATYEERLIQRLHGHLDQPLVAGVFPAANGVPEHAASVKAKIAGAVLGFAVGDAVGTTQWTHTNTDSAVNEEAGEHAAADAGRVPFRGLVKRDGQLVETMARMPRGTWSDATSCVLLLADSIYTGFTAMYDRSQHDAEFHTRAMRFGPINTAEDPYNAAARTWRDYGAVNVREQLVAAFRLDRQLENYWRYVRWGKFSVCEQPVHLDARLWVVLILYLHNPCSHPLASVSIWAGSERMQMMREKSIPERAFTSVRARQVLGLRQRFAPAFGYHLMSSVALFWSPHTDNGDCHGLPYDMDAVYQPGFVPPRIEEHDDRPEEWDRGRAWQPMYAEQDWTRRWVEGRAGLVRAARAFDTNGSLARVLPVPLVYWRDPTVANWLAERNSYLTENTSSMRCEAAGQAYTLLLGRILQEAYKRDPTAAGKEWLSDRERADAAALPPYTKRDLLTEIVAKGFPWRSRYYDPLIGTRNSFLKSRGIAPFLLLPEHEVPFNSNRAHENLITVLWIFFRSDSYEDAMLQVKRFRGSGANVIGALVGGLAGAWYAHDKEGILNGDTYTPIVKRNYVTMIATALIKLDEDVDRLYRLPYSETENPFPLVLEQDGVVKNRIRPWKANSELKFGNTWFRS